MSGWRISRVDLEGHVSLLLQTDGRRVLSWLAPSHDGHYLAFSQRTCDSNAWIMENF